MYIVVLEKPIPTISQLFPGKDWHDKKTFVMLFRAIKRLINELRKACNKCRPFVFELVRAAPYLVQACCATY
jgi:hypothetical protein